MNDQPELPKTGPGRSFGPDQARPFAFGIFVLVLSLCFLGPFKSLVLLALNDDLHSHLFLVPFIAAYILYIIRDQLPKTYRASLPGGIFILIIGIAFLIIATRWQTYSLTANILSFVCFVAAGGFIFLGSQWMKAAAFPVAFLLFLTPLPDPVVQWLENASKLASADCAGFFFSLTGVPVLRNGTVFQLPGIVIEVAQECSGIRSSFVLLIASILASYLFLRRPSYRLALVLVAIPLGVLRNGFRVTVIGLLCVWFGPQMIHSVIHKHGGPLFFVLSLIPLMAILWLLRRSEHRFGARTTAHPPSTGEQRQVLTNR
jgi:exosortase C (VPDSG-CTERM-specific)